MTSVAATDQPLPVSSGTSQNPQKKAKTNAPPTPVVDLGKRKSSPPDRLQSIDFRTTKPTINGPKKAVKRPEWVNGCG